MKEFPYMAWRLTPSFFIEPVKLVRESGYGAHISDKGKYFAPLTELFETQDAAAAAGYGRLESRRFKAQAQLDRLPQLVENLETSSCPL